MQFARQVTLPPAPCHCGTALAAEGVGLQQWDGNEILGFPGQRRGIAYVREEHCLKFVHLEIRDVRLHVKDEETGAPSFRTDNWVVTTWTNTLGSVTWCFNKYPL